MSRWVLWNLFLAVLPALLGWLLAVATGPRLRSPTLRWALGAPLAVLWLGFLPNSCYLLTEWRHLLFDNRWAWLRDQGNENAGAMLRAAGWALFFLGYSGLGVLLFSLAVRPVEQRLRGTGLRWYVAAPPIFALTSLGVYLGLIVRLNSWDLWERPVFVIEQALRGVTISPLLAAILVFAVLLWALYEAVDIWVDGVLARIRGFRGPSAVRASRSRPARARAA